MYLGCLADVTTTGFRLVSDQPLDTPICHRLRIQLPRNPKGVDEIRLSATTRWCTKELDSDFYSTGLQIQQISNDDAGLIEWLIRTYFFDDNGGIDYNFDFDVDAIQD